MSIGIVVPGSLGVVIASKDAEGVEVVWAGASIVLASGCVDRVPRFEFKGHPKPATVASRLFSMCETVHRRKLRNQKLREYIRTSQDQCIGHKQKKKGKNVGGVIN